ncbi:hypothetical protein [Desulfogranum japonicum]|uniref:hypothetical protein n=1 Tax=Desulfogranum japonicum TaxID=231447 RepID=UPI000415D6D7|nr:hypothetical protein [Desulfogranum japonicum]
MLKWRNLRKNFDKRPELLRCPNCRSELQQSEVGPTAYAQKIRDTAPDIYAFTLLYRCPQCPWWALREEYISSLFLNLAEDYLIFPPKDASLADVSENTWERILTDEDLNPDSGVKLKDEEVQWLFG